APVSGPAVSRLTFAEAEKLAQVTMSAAEREMVAASWRQSMAPLLERRVGPRKIALEPQIAPATRWNPVLAGESSGPTRDTFVRSKNEAIPLPTSDADIAISPVTQLSRWIEQKTLTSERLTTIYLTRIERFDPMLRCIITLTKDVALAQAKKADAEIAAGRYRGPLHGIPFGVKDLLDTAGIATTYGAEPFRNRVPAADSAVVRRLNEAGAVLIAKLSLGALALNATAAANGLRVGYFPAWMKENPATDVDRAALEAVKKLGMVATEVSLPDWPYGSLQHVLFSEAAAVFEELTLGGGLSTMKVQVPDAWPNLFRQARFLSAVDLVQADRFRRRVATEMAHVFSQVDVLLVPSLRDEMLTLSNFTGHPSLTLRAGF